MAEILTAAREYASRPKDERYASVADYLAHAAEVKRTSKEVTYNAKDLRAVLLDPTANRPNQTVALESPKGRAIFTHWSFGQLCRSISAPANYLRQLTPKLAADCINDGLANTPPATDLQLLVKAPNGNPYPIVRAATSESYGRVWDADLYGQVKALVMDHDDRWTTPPTWSGEPAGMYGGDRDSFLITVNGGSIVTDPSARTSSGTTGNGPQQTNGPDGGMYRGILIRNSEVGASSIQIETVLYRFICGNHIIWGATVDTKFRRRHVGGNALRDTLRELGRIAHQYANQSAAKDEAIIRMIIDKEIAHTKEAVLDELHKMGVPREAAARAYQLCEERESVSPRSFWGAVQGLTRASQETDYQDDRYVLDQLAAKVLTKARKLVLA